MRTTTLERTRFRFGTPVDTEGLLAGVHRPCPEHHADAACVACTDEGNLVFWCARGDHHFTAPARSAERAH